MHFRTLRRNFGCYEFALVHSDYEQLIVLSSWESWKVHSDIGVLSGIREPWRSENASERGWRREIEESEFILHSTSNLESFCSKPSKAMGKQSFSVHIYDREIVLTESWSQKTRSARCSQIIREWKKNVQNIRQKGDKIFGREKRSLSFQSIANMTKRVWACLVW